MVELLIVAGVGSVVMAGTLKTLTISTQSAAVVRSSLSEQELRLSVSRALTEDWYELKKWTKVKRFF